MIDYVNGRFVLEGSQFVVIITVDGVEAKRQDLRLSAIVNHRSGRVFVPARGASCYALGFQYKIYVRNL